MLNQRVFRLKASVRVEEPEHAFDQFREVTDRMLAKLIDEVERHRQYEIVLEVRELPK